MIRRVVPLVIILVAAVMSYAISGISGGIPMLVLGVILLPLISKSVNRYFPEPLEILIDEDGFRQNIKKAYYMIKFSNLFSKSSYEIAFEIDVTYVEDKLDPDQFAQVYWATVLPSYFRQGFDPNGSSNTDQIKDAVRRHMSDFNNAVSFARSHVEIKLRGDVNVKELFEDPFDEVRYTQPVVIPERSKSIDKARHRWR